MKKSTLPKVSILVAARNEAANIGRCIDSLLRLEYPIEQLEILIGDDASEDQTAEIIKYFALQNPHIQLISIRGNIHQQKGKSNVLAQLALKASGEYLFFTDADIAVPPTWIRAMLEAFDEQDGIISGCTNIEGTHWLSRFQAIEWLNAQATITWLSERNIPVTGVGNNMAVRQEAYRQVGGYENLPFSITEDYQLFRVILEKGWQFKNLYTTEVLAASQPMLSLKALMIQRKRWLYGALRAQWYLQGVFYAQALFLPLFLAVWLLSGYAFALSLLATKLLVESVLIGRAIVKIGQHHLLKWLPIFEIYYVFLNFAMLIYYYLPVPTQWKGRHYEHL